MIECNLLRVADHDKLQRSFSIVTDAAGQVVVPKLLDTGEFIAADQSTPKFDHWWAFPACAFNDTFAGNERALFEEVRNDPSTKKIVQTGRAHVCTPANNANIVCR